MQINADKNEFNIIRLKKVSSTNTYLKNLIFKKRIPSFTIVIAEHQTVGRGQGSNTWNTNPNENLTCSIYFDSSLLSFENLFVLNKCIALCVRTAISEHLPNKSIYIKWPNDIIVDNKKIAGILVENSFMGNNIQSVIGVGININQMQFGNTSIEATSFRLLNGKESDVESVFEGLLKFLYNDLQKLNSTHFQTTVENTYDKHLFRLNKLHTFYLHSEKVQGVIRGVDKQGRLVFKPQTSAKELHIEHGSIKYCF